MDKAGVHARMPGSGLAVPTPTGQHGQGRGQGGPHGQPPGRGRGVGRGYGTAAVVLAGGHAAQTPAAGPPPTYEQSVLADSPVYFFQVDEVSGATMVDDSGNGYDGTYNTAGGGGPTYQEPPLINAGHSIYWPGTSPHFAAMPNVDLAGGTGAVTVEAWLKTTQATDGMVVNGDSSGGGYRYLRFYVTGGKIALLVFNTSGSSDTVTSLTSINDNAAHHVVGTYDGATMKVYVDGVLDNSKVPSFSPKTLAAHSPQQTMAVLYYGGYGTYYGGYMDEVAFYTKALSATRVAAHYQAGTT